MLTVQLLNRNPKHRLGATRDAKELREHAFFSDIDWLELSRKNVAPPFKPSLTSETDTSNFDPEFTNAPTGSLNARAAAVAASNMPASTPLSPGMQANFRGFTFVDESSIDDHFGDSERMEEDHLEHEWEQPRNGTHHDNDRGGFDSKAGSRMSGIIRTGNGEDESGIFNNGGMEI